jgi:hypothetical protein
MNPLNILFNNPVADVVRAIVMPFKFVFVVGICFLINWMTFSGYWWVKWVALGMGIAVLVSWARLIKSLFIVAIVAAIGYFIYKRYGAAAKAKFDAWRNEGQPKQPSEAVQFLIESQTTKPAASSVH